jgi:hypothetical protein
MSNSFDTVLLQDSIDPDAWRVEYFDNDGGCYVAIFAGPAADQRARDYREALTAGRVARVDLAGGG